MSSTVALDIKNQLFSNGLDSYLLKPDAQSWQKGKFKVELSVKFYPDESEEEIE